MSSRRTLLALATLGALAGSAAASPESEKLFREGRELLKAGKIPEACEAFAGSQKLAAKVGTLLNLADCREKQGQTATAWSLFLEAKRLAAAQHGDAHAGEAEAEAEKRASAIQARLSYLTITVASERQVDGLVIKRNGLIVDRAQWNTPVAVDPGDHVVEASAPKYKPWSTTQTLGVKQKASVVVDALAVEPSKPDRGPDVTGPSVIGPDVTGPDAGNPAERHGGAVAPETHVVPDPPVRPLGIGLLVGASGDQDTLIGARVSGGFAAPQGAIRAIGSMLYTRFGVDPADPGSGTNLFALGLSVDYVWMPLPKVAFGVGLGFGTDHLGNLGGDDGSIGWWTLRASPVIARVLNGRVEAGLHLQYVRTSERGVVLGLAAIELFPL